jgi:uncharacterized membrane protein
MTHALCAIGVYLGRFKRFNSWDFVTQPDDLARSVLDDLTSKRPVVVIALTFAIVTILYWLMKQVTLALLLRMRYKSSGRSASEPTSKTDTDTSTTL